MDFDELLEDADFFDVSADEDTMLDPVEEGLLDPLPAEEEILRFSSSYFMVEF